MTTDSEILRQVGLGTLLDNVDNNCIGRRVLRAMLLARQDVDPEKSAIELIVKWCMDMGIATGHADTLGEILSNIQYYEIHKS